MLTGSIKIIVNKLLFKKFIISHLSKIEKAVKTLTNVLKIFINFSLYLIDTFFINIFMVMVQNLFFLSNY